MAFICIPIVCFIILLHFFIKKPNMSFITTNWPLIGMLPGLLMVLHRIYDFTVELLENSNLTFQFKGPLLAGMDMLITIDPANIHYMLSSNFLNYNKGPDFKEVFDVFKDVIFNVDAELWKNHRKAAEGTLKHQGFARLSVRATRSKLKNGLVPVFDHFAKEGMVMNLQDVFRRFTFDISMVLITGSDPTSLSIDMPENEFDKALTEAIEGILYRHVKPRFLWKLQRWMGLGIEKKMLEADDIFYRVCAKYISAKREEVRLQGINHQSPSGEGEDLLTSYIKLDTTQYETLNPSDDRFLKDVILSYIVAGRDTIASALTWFFWILSENPNVTAKIRQEINKNLQKSKTGQEKSSLDPSELNKLVYLHAALYESMRLYPPAPFERTSPIKKDVLPSGHKVHANAKIIILLYALGRMKAVWGEDASEFKPERWVTNTGSLRHEPSFKFLAFNAGPRSCLGKQLAMNLMKTVIVEILQNYDIHVIKGQKIEPLPSLILRMKHGLSVTITKRD
ncbi:alkane hydroxylase MAH1-like [Brassica napus]|uniref:alkane hydroxylase MAH1-like n=1 Tax=Brassica napus TaxID=3708 RepID=UPI0020789F33|nr:alkane hydroxylase MAH1-like [Brassica napus]